MKPVLVLIPLALEWLIVASTVAPLLFGSFSKRPRLGIAAWFSLFLSAGVAFALAFAISIWAIIDNFINLERHRQNLFLTIVFSLAPWLLFAMAGIAINLINIKIEPSLAKFKELFSAPVLPARHLKKFQGVEVQTIELDAYLAFSLAKPDQRILLSTHAVDHLPADQLEAVLWHELGHLRGRHARIKQLVGLVVSLAGRIRASRAMRHEVERLCELAADQFALKHVEAATLAAARGKFA